MYKKLTDEQDEMDSDEEFGMYPLSNPTFDTSRIDEIPAREPKLNAVPLKSALKKKTSNPSTPTQEGANTNTNNNNNSSNNNNNNINNKTLIERQGNSAFK